LPSKPMVLPNTTVVKTTRVRQVVTITLRFAKPGSSLSTRPKAIAPRMSPAKEMKVSSLHVSLLTLSFSYPQSLSNPIKPNVPQDLAQIQIIISA
jgi:hypothetical protein